MTKTTAITESEIPEHLIASASSKLTPEAARGFLTLKFDRETTRQIQRLLRENNRGTISAEERLALENYLRVGSLLDVLHANARAVLAKTADGR